MLSLKCYIITAIHSRVPTGAVKVLPSDDSSAMSTKTTPLRLRAEGGAESSVDSCVGVTRIPERFGVSMATLVTSHYIPLTNRY